MTITSVRAPLRSVPQPCSTEHGLDLTLTRNEFIPTTRRDDDSHIAVRVTYIRMQPAVSCLMFCRPVRRPTMDVSLLTDELHYWWHWSVMTSHVSASRRGHVTTTRDRWRQQVSAASCDSLMTSLRHLSSSPDPTGRRLVVPASCGGSRGSRDACGVIDIQRIKRMWSTDCCAVPLTRSSKHGDGLMLPPSGQQRHQAISKHPCLLGVPRQSTDYISLHVDLSVCLSVVELIYSHSCSTSSLL